MTFFSIHKNKTLIIAASFVSVIPFSVSLFPYKMPLFLPLSLLLFLSVIVCYRNLFFGAWTIILSILVLSYILPILITEHLDNPNLKDFRNIIAFLLLFSALYTLFNEESHFKTFTVYFQSFYVIFSAVISLIGLTKLLLLIDGKKIGLLFTGRGVYPWGTSLIADYNVFGTGLTLGLISCFFLYRQATSLRLKYLLLICCLTICAAAALSGSRRSWLIIFAICTFLIANIVIKYLAAVQFRIRKFHIANLFIVMMLLVVFGFNSGWISRYFQNEQPKTLTKMWNRFKTLENIFHGEGGIRSRTERFKYAIQIIDEYNFTKLILGNGSEYHTQYGQEFSVSSSDKPHNILISALLHSGIIGLVIAVLSIVYSTFLYIKLFFYDEVRFFFYLFIVLTFLTFTSSDTIFSSKRFLFCLLLPYIIGEIYKTHPLKN